MQLDTDMRHSLTVPAKGRTAPFDPAVAGRLLNLLCTDDAYRALFQQDPRAALARVGHELADREECFFGISLASKEVIADARNEILAMLFQGLGQIPPQLDSDLRNSVRRC